MYDRRVTTGSARGDVCGFYGAYVFAEHPVDAGFLGVAAFTYLVGEIEKALDALAASAAVLLSGRVDALSAPGMEVVAQPVVSRPARMQQEIRRCMACLRSR